MLRQWDCDFHFINISQVKTIDFIYDYEIKFRTFDRIWKGFVNDQLITYHLSEFFDLENKNVVFNLCIYECKHAAYDDRPSSQKDRNLP